MDILYIVGENCSKCNNNELRYSLRSIEKYGKNVDRIYVAGYCPEWLNDKVVKVFYKLPKAENLIEKHINMLETILYVVDNTDIGEEFLISMDDHFYIKETDFNNYPIYAKIIKEDVQLDSNRTPPSTYEQFILLTKEVCKTLELPTYFFTLHRNMHCSRQIIKNCREILEHIIKNKIACEPIVLMLNYTYKQKPFLFMPIKDVKIFNDTLWYKANPSETEVFSTSDFESNSKLDILIRNLFPNKSKYEK